MCSSLVRRESVRERRALLAGQQRVRSRAVPTVHLPGVRGLGREDLRRTKLSGKRNVVCPVCFVLFCSFVSCYVCVDFSNKK